MRPLKDLRLWVRGNEIDGFVWELLDGQRATVAGTAASYEGASLDGRAALRRAVDADRRRRETHVSEIIKGTDL